MRWHDLIPVTDLDKTLVVFHDHQFCTKRIQQLLGFGFSHAWHGINREGGGMMTMLNEVCAPLPEHVQEPICLTDNFYQKVFQLSRAMYMIMTDYVFARMEIYFESPPILDGCGQGS